MWAGIGQSLTAADILMDGDTGEQCATELVEATYFNKYPRSA
jgi:hypothetical protein